MKSGRRDRPRSVLPLIGFCSILLALSAGGCGALGLTPFPRRRLAVAGGLLAYGIAIELLQSQLPPRTAELADLAANLGGMAIGALLLPTALGRLLLAIEHRLPSRTRL